MARGMIRPERADDHAPHLAPPEEFGLVVSGARAMRRVRLRWQNGNTLGANFID